jgi:hypothetical protein
MTHQPTNVSEQAAYDDSYIDAEQEPGLLDVIRFLYKRRVKLTLYFSVIFVLCALAALFWILSSPNSSRSVEGTLDLNFRGIEKGEYPSGKKFSIEDFRSPDLLTKVLADAGISAERVSLQELVANVSITSVIPAEIRTRWLAEDKLGMKQDEYHPSEFKIGITLGGLTDAQRLRLCDAVISRYRERIKYDQNSARAFVSSWASSYDKLANIYDFWDIPELFRESSRSLDRNLTTLIGESAQYQDARSQLSFQEIGQDLDAWDRTRLQALEALTYQGQLVRNRDIVMQRIQYRIQKLDIQIKQETQEANNAIHLLEVIDRPNALLAGQPGTPMVDASALDKLIRSDYVGPVVQRVSNLQHSIQTMESDKALLEKQLSWLPKSSTAGQVPPGYKELTDTLSSELNSIIKNYNRLLDDYLTATITSLVIVTQPPHIVISSGYSNRLILAGVVFLSFILALIVVGVERFFEKVREEPQAHKYSTAEGAEGTEIKNLP